MNRKLLEVAAGKIKRLIVTMPPRHGKSEFISHYLPAWYLGTFPDRGVILASYESTFASSWGRKAREVLETHGRELFGVEVNPEARSMDWWELKGRGGRMHAVGAMGPLTGKGGQLLIADDLVKNHEEAASEVYREKMWEWWTSTFLTRLEEGGAVIVVMTRWHTDDIVGRILEHERDRWSVLKLPAVAEQDEDFGCFKRRQYDPLCPPLFSLETLRTKEKEVGEYVWATMFQCRPYNREGNFFRRSNFPLAELPPNFFRIRAWDLAASNDGDFTVGLRLAKDLSGNLYIDNIVRGRWTPGRRDEIIKKTVERDGRGTVQFFPEDPAQAGRSQTEALQKLLYGWRCEFIRCTGDKVVRAGPVASFSESGKMRMLNAGWNDDFLDEAEAFPKGKFDDQVDALSLAFSGGKSAEDGEPVKGIADRTFPRSLMPDEKPTLTEAQKRDLGINSGEWRRDDPPDPLDRLFGNAPTLPPYPRGFRELFGP